MIYILVYFIIGLLGVSCVSRSLILSNYRSNRATLSSQCSRNGVNLFLLFALIVFTFMAAFRGSGVGTDTQSYSAIYDLFAKGNTIANVRKFATTIETGYLSASYVIIHILKHRVFYFLCNALVIYGGYLTYVRRHSDDIVFSVLLFTALFFTSTFNVMRQYVAIGLMFAALSFFRERSHFKAALLTAIAILMHKSSLLFLPGLLLIVVPNKRKHMLLYEFVIVATMVALGNDSILSFFVRLFGYDRFLNRVHFRPSASSGTMALIYIFIIFVGVLVAVIKKDIVDEDFAFNLINASIGAGFAFLAKSNEMFARPGAGYLLFITMLLPQIVRVIITKDRDRIIVKTIIYPLLAIAMYISGRGYPYTLFY